MFIEGLCSVAGIYAASTREIPPPVIELYRWLSAGAHERMSNAEACFDGL
jgi:hypothetical protein